MALVACPAPVGLVPATFDLHEGHLSLVRHARAEAPSLFHYYSVAQRLELLRGGDLRYRVQGIIATDGFEPSVETCAAILLMTVRWKRSFWKYGERAYWLALIEAGHIGQHALLTATRLDIAAAPTASLRAAEVGALLELDPREEAAIYAIILGHHDRGHGGTHD
jgi:SagB-type dehydrogenase family enzyme